MKKFLLTKFVKSAVIIAVYTIIPGVQAQNLLTINPSFEEGTGTGVGSSLNGGYWSRVNSGNATAVQNYLYRESANPIAQNGTYYAKAVTPSEAGFNTPSALQAINTQNLTTTLTNGHSYRISFYYQNTASHSFKAVVENNDGTSQVGSLLITTEATAWTFASFIFTLNTASLTDGRLKLQFGSNTGTTIVDNVKIEDVLTLPVSLISFSVQPKASSVDINWESSAEINNAHYDVLRSADGINFSLLKSVTAANHAAKYSTSDVNPLNGTSYYKLLQYDANGASKELAQKAVSFDFATADAFVVYPNPAKDNFKLELNSLQAGNVNVSISTLNGDLVQQEIVEKAAGTSIHSIVLESVNPGIYILKIKGEDLNKVLKLLVQ